MNVLPNLNPLRFFLAVMVLVFHVPMMSKNMGLAYFDDFSLFHKGEEAVYVFFVLSGFLIIRSLWIEKNKGTIQIKKFYIRRILRIFPLYFLIVFFGFFYYQFFLDIIGIEFENNYNLLEAIILYVFFLPNVAKVDLMPGGILEILWSIGIEEQFYLLIAPIFGFLSKKRILIFLSVFTVIYIVVFHYLEVLEKYHLLYFYFSFGGLIGVLFEKEKLSLPKIAKIILGVLFITYFFTDIFTILDPIYYHVVSMLVFGLFILSICDNPVFTIKNRSLNHLGRISYGIYVYHPFAMQLVLFLFLKLKERITIMDDLVILAINLLVLLLTIIVAHFSYKYYELYFLKLKNKFRE